MSFPPTLPAPILETILTHLASLFLAGANGCPAAARQAAVQLLAAYHPETEDELRLAANIAIFSFEALQALSQAAAPGLSMTRVLRLRSGAVSLSREAAKAERRLAQLRNPGKQPVPAKPAEPPAEAAVPPEHTIAADAKAKNLTWTQAYQQRQRDRRIAARLQKAAAGGAAAMTSATAHHQQSATGI